MTERIRIEGILRRTKQAREHAHGHGYTQVEMAAILRIGQGTYQKYEVRTPLPYRHLAAFCAATGVSAEWLLGLPMSRYDPGSGRQTPPPGSNEPIS